jgi:hypothetical protein
MYDISNHGLRWLKSIPMFLVQRGGNSVLINHHTQFSQWGFGVFSHCFSTDVPQTLSFHFIVPFMKLLLKVVQGMNCLARNYYNYRNEEQMMTIAKLVICKTVKLKLMLMSEL